MGKDDWKSIFRALGLLTELGLVIIANIGVGFIIGYLVDRATGSELFFKLTGLILGVISGFYSDYRLINKLIGDNKDDKNE